MRERYWLICYMWEGPQKRPFTSPGYSRSWSYANAVTHNHPTEWLKAHLDSGAAYVLVSYHEIMPHEYNDLVKIL